MSFSTNQSTDTITSSTGNGSLSGFNVNFATNRLVNPFMSIDQANEGASITLTGSNAPYTADQWVTSFVQTGLAGTTTVQTVTDAPTALPGGRSLKFTMGTGHAISAGDFGLFSQHIEAYNLTDVAFGTASASPISISFWVKTSLTGATFAVAMLNGPGTRTYLVNYTVATANTWTKITLPNIPGDVTGTWFTESNGIGMQLFFTFGVGSTYQGVAGWQTGSFFGTSSNTNLLATTGATFQLTGVQLEPGPVCTPIERRPFAFELAICQRYYEKSYDLGVAVKTGGVAGYAVINTGAAQTVANAVVYPGSISYAVRKRATPVTAIYSFTSGTAGAVSNADGTDLAAGSGALNNSTTSTFLVLNSSGGTITTTKNYVIFHWAADARL